MNMITLSESGTLTPYLPIVIPFVIIELILLLAAFVHLLTHKEYKHGTRLLWVGKTGGRFFCLNSTKYIIQEAYRSGGHRSASGSLRL